jgi:oligopeptide transport system substrate-binding protein
MKKIFALMLAIVLTIGAFGCAGGTGNSEKTVYRSLHGSDVSTLNYLNTTSTGNMGIPANCQEWLVEYDALGNIQPGLALEWSVDDTNLVWTFKLRQDAKWYNNKGEAVANVTAHDFVTSAEYALSVNASAAYMYEEAMIKNATAMINGEVSFEEVGVRAVDDYTLEFTLEAPCSYFLTCLNYGCFAPMSAETMKAVGDWDNRANWTVEEWDAFSEALDGIQYNQLLYCGAYYLLEYLPGESYRMLKNENYWDKDKVYITEIQSTYNKEASTISPEMYLRGELEDASITSTMAQSWMEDPEKAGYVHPDRIMPDYSYFFSFNFDPQFDAQYEPENWKIAVNNENFRKSIFHGINRLGATMISDPNNAETLLQNTITPTGFCAAGGSDYSEYDVFADLAVSTDTKDAYFNEDLAKQYRDAAITELTAEGATFPIKVLLPYNPNTSDWDSECLYIQQQLEGLLGTDYIDIIVEQGPTQNFLSEVRRSGKYALLKTNWGCDYADPLTYAAGPFGATNTYQFMYRSEDAETKALVDEYYAMVAEANAIVDADKLAERYAAFAEAEAFLIEHAMVLPFGVSGGYSASYLNPFEGQYSPYGIATLRYKGQHILEKPMSTEEFNAALEKWQKDRAESAK